MLPANEDDVEQVSSKVGNERQVAGKVHKLTDSLSLSLSLSLCVQMSQKFQFLFQLFQMLFSLLLPGCLS
jgi:hypothetical protein